jgi:hypothetical protein
LDGYWAQIKALDREEQQVTAALEELVRQSGSTLGELCGLSTRSVAELLVEVGDMRRFTEGGFARFNGTAPLPASTAEGPGEPVRHRYNPGGNRRVNAVLHRMAITQLGREPRAQRIYAGARAGGHTKKEARRVLKRHLSGHHLPPYDPRPGRPRPSRGPRPAPPRCITARDAAQSRNGPTGPSVSEPRSGILDGTAASARLRRREEIGNHAFPRVDRNVARCPRMPRTSPRNAPFSNLQVAYRRLLAAASFQPAAPRT